MAMTLAMSSAHPFLIFCATVSSMIVVSSMGILVGKYVGKNIPKVAVSYLAAALFLLFGVSKLYGAVDPGFYNRAGSPYSPLYFRRPLCGFYCKIKSEEERKRSTGNQSYSERR